MTGVNLEGQQIIPVNEVYAQITLHFFENSK